MLKKISTAGASRSPVPVSTGMYVIANNLTRKPDLQLSRLQRAELERLDRYGRFGRK